MRIIASLCVHSRAGRRGGRRPCPPRDPTRS